MSLLKKLELSPAKPEGGDASVVPPDLQVNPGSLRGARAEPEKPRNSSAEKNRFRKSW
jgi:hypothetical protein